MIRRRRMARDSTDHVAAVQEANIDGRYIASAVVTWTSRRGETDKLDTQAVHYGRLSRGIRRYREVPSAHSRVLDCACGTGQLAGGLASLGLDVVATDASLAMVCRTFNPEAGGYMVVAGRE